MKITPYAIEKLLPFITGDQYQPKRNGRELIDLFNRFGSRDIYDEQGLPDIGKKNEQRPSRKEYVKARLLALNDNYEFREFLVSVINDIESKDKIINKLNEILNPEGYQVTLKNGQLMVEGGIIDRRKPVINEAHFEDVQNRILSALENARVSIRVVMAWFTNEILFNKLAEKHRKGIDVKIAIYNDGMNKKHGVNIGQLNHVMIKHGKRGGLMHDKFCVIDNQIVITGSYNWTNNAEFRNDENVTVENDPEQATRFSEEFQRLTT